ncbi:MAG: hypothetical protein AKCLJLPJ_01073 [Fimbriimonadales bacterium]|nr:MAG: hypothetical protein EDM73_05105 [Armatimonadota bacterium]MBV6503012.1 hypothetical protein [Fimbriimonadales bacterium]MCE7899365.1 hypothetical protein [Armatimonadetes bacterium ATM1]MDL1927940.1 hypothetical protein [Fimbriimonadia bacterium ATM]MBC6969296.1 hypothetical protein [Armatimonadota bacterium]
MKLLLAPALAGIVLGTLPVSSTKVVVSGAVNEPKALSLDKPIPLREAIHAAGGLRPDADAMRIAVQFREGHQSVYNATLPGPLCLIRPGDRVDVPVRDEGKYVHVSGAVGSPGYVEFAGGLNVREALSRAGGMITDASVVKVTRNAGDAGPEIYVLNLDDDSDGGDFLVQPADRIEVPHARSMAASDRELLTIIVVGLLILLLVK